MSDMASVPLRRDASSVALARWLVAIGARGDAVAAVLIALVVAMMIVPLPPIVIDALIAVNIGAAVLLIALAMYLPSAASFSSFPVVLLLTTLFRLGIEVSTSRSLLLHADAGHIVDTFGRFVAGDDISVGLIVFAVIAIVQFLVVTKGAERVAEVGARFALDAMPGRQMAIDADLRAGFTRPETAQRLREDLARESRMHGAMDGAMRFVKGDAIAALAIVAVNLTAGVAIGVARRDLSLSDAFERYAILAIGNALVAQIPALLIAIAAALLVTRVGEESGSQGSTVGGQIAHQVLGAPAAWLLAAFVTAVLTVVPGMPWLVFLLLSIAMAAIGAARLRREAHARERAASPVRLPVRDGVPDDVDVRQIVPIRAIVVALSSRAGTGNADAAAERDQAVRRAIRRIRNELVLRYGMTVPVIEVDRVERLDADDYEVAVHEVAVASGRLHWERDGLLAAGDLALALRRALQRHAARFVGIHEAQLIFNWLQREMPAMAKELAQATTLPRFAEVMKLLVLERVSLRNVREIAEALVAWAPREKETTMLAEHVRVALAEQICAEFARDGVLRACLLERTLEAHLTDALTQTAAGPLLTIEPDLAEHLIRQIRVLAATPPEPGADLVLLTTQQLRRPLRHWLADELAETYVLSYAEVVSTQRVKVLGSITLDSASPTPTPTPTPTQTADPTPGTVA